MILKASRLRDSAKSASTLVVLSYQTKGPSKGSSIKVSATGLSKESLQLITKYVDEKTFSAKANETLLLRQVAWQTPNDQHLENLLVVGLGQDHKVDLESARQAGAAAQKTLSQNNLLQASFLIENLGQKGLQKADMVQALCEGLLLAEYDYKTYQKDRSGKAPKKKDAKKPLSVSLSLSGKGSLTTYQKSIQSAQILTECVNFSRWLGDSPGNLMTPTDLAKATQEAAKGTGLKVTVWDRARIKKEKMGGLYGVSLGSAQEPRFIAMEYRGAGAQKKPICFVGKGLTFDSGGISIKPAQAMDEMKYDMCGGANVIGAVLAIARLKLKVNVTAFVPSSENMSGASATKPGDILTARNGKTVEVLNTDAEGRLILMDALSYATEQKPAAIVDAATLTGAMVISLGNVYTGAFTRNEKMGGKIKKAAEKSGENVWLMPIHDQYVSDMKGTFADLSNISATRAAGSCTAAAFLEQFVGSEIPWAHFDIAGTAWNVGGRLNYCPKKGASGSMIRTFVELAKQF